MKRTGKADLKSMQQLLAGEVRFYHTEKRYLHKAGHDVWALLGVSLIHSAEGEPLHFVSQIQDITARKQADEAAETSAREQRELTARLATEKARLIAAQAVAKVGSWETDLSTNKVTWSDETYRIFETSPEQFQPTHAGFLQLVHPEDRAAVDKAFGECCSGDSLSAIEHRLLLPGGGIKLVEERWHTARDEEGKPIYATGTCQDITKRRAAEEALRSAELKYRSIFENALEGIFQNTPEGTLISANPALARMLGFENPEELIRERSDLARQSYVDPAQRPEFQRRLDEDGVVTEFEYEVKRKDGSPIWVSENVRVIRDPTGLPLLYEGTIQDISDRRRAETANRRLLEILDATTDLVSIANLEGSLLYLNPAGRRMLGVGETGDLKARVIGDFLPDAPNHIILQEALPAAARDGVWSGETILRSLDGGEVHTSQVILSHKARDGKVDVLSTIARDITERIGAERELEELNKQLVETSRQAGMAEVATSVLHNVGNVLNSVNVSCSVISDTVRRSRIDTLTRTAELLRQHAEDLPAFLTTDPTGKKLPEFLRKLAQRLGEEQAVVLGEAKSLSQNIEHIKDIVAVQQNYAKNMGGVRETLALDGLVEDALRMNGSALTRHRIEVIREFAEVAPISVEKNKVLQILVNLLRNAKHALTDGGSEHKRLVLRIAAQNGDVAVSVSDNGVGILAENMTRIFTHGFTTKKDGHGFGLHNGVLAAEEMGGSLRVESEGPGRGATFTLRLPRNGRGKER